MFRTTVCAALAATLAATPAGAAPACMTDPSQDVVVTGTSVPVDAPHLDIVRLSVARGARDLVAVFDTAGGPGRGIWSMYFEYDARYEFYVRVTHEDGLSWADPRQGAPWLPVYATVRKRGVSSSTLVEGVTADLSRPGTVRVRVPLAKLGPATPKRGATARVTWARARQAPVGQPVEFEDYAGCGFRDY